MKLQRLAVEDLADALFFAKDLFRAPGADQWGWLTSEPVAAFWKELSVALELEGCALELPESAERYEIEFIEAFEAGAPNPPVPLIESHYNKRDPVPKILHENILFYQTFGLRLKASANETADHLRHQLEFVGYLYRLEASELAGANRDEYLAQIREARQEYAERHLLSWLPKAAERARPAPNPWVSRHLAVALALAKEVAGTSLS
jgi:DMSO reductase family type II enzyme chaperone